MHTRRIDKRLSRRLNVLLPLVFAIFLFCPDVESAPYDVTVTLTSESGVSGMKLLITEPTGEVASLWHDTTLIGGWVSTDSGNTYQRYHLANAMSGYYYIEVEIGSPGDVDCQVVAILYEGTVNETVITWPFKMYKEERQVGCFKMPQGTKIEWGIGESGGNCFIATAAYGTRFADEVGTLSRFRDEWLLTSAPGRSLVGLYYRFSPPAAGFIARRPFLRKAVRMCLKPSVALAKLLVRGQ